MGYAEEARDIAARFDRDAAEVERIVKSGLAYGLTWVDPLHEGLS